jgi:hypothetical protein
MFTLNNFSNRFRSSLISRRFCLGGLIAGGMGLLRALTHCILAL